METVDCQTEVKDEGMDIDYTALGESNIQLKIQQTIAEKESEVLSLIISNHKDNEGFTDIIDESRNEAEELTSEICLEVNSIENDNEVSSSIPAEGIELLVNENKLDANIETFEFHAADAAWISLLDDFQLILNEGRIRGYVEGEKAFLCLWESFQTSTMSTFSVRSSDRFYRTAKEGEQGSVHGRILKGAAKWSRLPLVPYDGIPFVMMDRKYFGCR